MADMLPQQNPATLYFKLEASLVRTLHLNELLGGHKPMDLFEIQSYLDLSTVTPRSTHSLKHSTVHLTFLY